MFENIAGQEQVKDTIVSMLESDRLPHALLFAGPYGVGKCETALELARMLLCENGPLSGCTGCSSCNRSSRLEHPDLHLLFPFRAEPVKSEDRDKWIEELESQRKVFVEQYPPVSFDKNRQIVVGLAREIHERLQESSFERGRRVCVVINADKMNPQTANSLLKILEEPPAGVHFIMTAERLSSVLPTIISRASVFRFRRLNEEEIAVFLGEKCGVEPETGKACAAVAEGSLKTAKALAFDKKSDVLSQAYDIYRTVALSGPEEIVGHVFPFSRSRDIAGAEELIGGFALCTRSVLEAKYGMERSGGDMEGVLSSLSEATDLHALHELSVRLEDGLGMLERNVNVSTVMTSIFYGINDAYRH